MKIKTSELTGKPLDYAVAVAEGYTPYTDGISWIVDVGGASTQLFNYSNKWVAGGPIIEREKIAIDPDGWRWVASTNDRPICYSAETPLIAAMRCYVESKLGDEVEIPEELK